MFVPPEHRKAGFTCPYCQAYAKHFWADASYWGDGLCSIKELSVAFCTHCDRYSIWISDIMVYPVSAVAPAAHPDMPMAIREDYEEARAIAARSPRSAAALLRLCIQKLCRVLGEKGKDLNSDIAALVGKGLPVLAQRALDIVRVIGNEQVHPGTLDVRDDPQVAIELFKLVNFIVDNQIAQPKAIHALYESLPETKRKQIEERDRKSEKA
uniref:DUF4145 domain-containing protein n=1 Tax=Acidobacterium capsulatum TaxID=33075 RepID=A0A7V4XUQ3_9BACT